MDVATVARVSGLLIGAGIAISTLEFIANIRQCRSDGLFSWEVWRETKWRSHPRLKRAANPLFAYPGVLIVLLARLALIALLLFELSRGSRLDPILLTAIVATQLYINFRYPCGKDGSDQMSTIVLIMLCLIAWFPARPVIAVACVVFIAFQSLLSYLTAGIAKLVSPDWRSGDVILGVVGTRTYGSRFMAGLLRDHKLLRRTMNYSTIAFESLIVLALVLPHPWNAYFLVIPLIFHVACAVMMGLNIFVFAFAATFPALLYVSNHLHKIVALIGSCNCG
ncbi:MAG TPA: HTTM domain-containing protein [Thermoanaerobaculia bacterium]|nr:HTTM domain-containing protein [Thermoanaerobaculia bacterium]